MYNICIYIYTRISVYIYIYHDATWAYVCFKLRTPTCFFFRDIGIATGFCWAEHGPHEVRGALAELRCATTPQWAYPKLPKLCRQVLDLCSICVGMAATFTMNDVDVFWKMADFPASHSNSFLGCHDQGIWEKEKGATRRRYRISCWCCVFTNWQHWISICLSTKWETTMSDWLRVEHSSNINWRFSLQDDSFNMYYY